MLFMPSFSSSSVKEILKYLVELYFELSSPKSLTFPGAPHTSNLPSSFLRVINLALLS